MANIIILVAEITGCNHFFRGQDHFFRGLDIFLSGCGHFSMAKITLYWFG